LPHLSHHAQSRPMTSRTHAAAQHKENLEASKAASSLNIYVKSPFKHFHQNQQQSHQSGVVSPDAELIRHTAQATYNISQFAANNRLNSSVSLHSRRHLTHGHLHHARPAPLIPVTIEGPQISQCRGIVAGTRPQSTSRTLARQRLIVAMLASEAANNSYTNHQLVVDQHQPNTK
jgi:hypothetical protein